MFKLSCSVSNIDNLTSSLVRNYELDHKKITLMVQKHIRTANYYTIDPEFFYSLIFSIKYLDFLHKDLIIYI